MLAERMSCSPSLIARIEDGTSASSEWWDRLAHVEEELQRSGRMMDDTSEVDLLVKLSHGLESDDEPYAFNT